MPIDWQAPLNTCESSGESDAARAAAYRRCFSVSFRSDAVPLPACAPAPQELSNSMPDAAISIGGRSLISFALELCIIRAVCGRVAKSPVPQTAGYSMSGAFYLTDVSLKY